LAVDPMMQLLCHDVARFPNVDALPYCIPPPLVGGGWGRGPRAERARESKPGDRERPTLCAPAGARPRPQPPPTRGGGMVSGGLQPSVEITARPAGIANQRFRGAAVLRYTQRQRRNACARF